MSLMEKQFCTFPEDKAAARVAVAQDVIDQIRAKVMTADNRGYVCPLKGWYVSHGMGFEGVADNCTVCAMGGLLLSSFRLFDGEGFDWIWTEDASQAYAESIQYQLAGLFSREQLDTMEAAFEGWRHGVLGNGIDVVDWHPFYMHFMHPNDRLIAIMQNVVDNGGTFIVADALKEVA